MSLEVQSSPFIVTEHIIPCSYITEYPRATSTEREDILHLFIKQYTPRDNLSPKQGDLTIIATHGNGMPKELYEPLWELIYRRSKNLNFRIRSIWIADSAHQGASGVFNEAKLGSDVSWFDHARDLLAMVNQFRGEMPQPLIGIGHSMGAVQLVLTSIIHPRLFTSIALLEPVTGKSIEDCQGPAFVRISSFRKEIWNSHYEAVAASKKMYKNWDPRVLKMWLKYGLRTLPTDIYSVDSVQTSCSGELPVTLTTSKFRVVSCYFRPNFDGFIGGVFPKGEVPYIKGLKDVDEQTPAENIPAFYHTEPKIAFNNLQYPRPHVLYIFGTDSPVSTPRLRKEKMERTGTGVTGNGGVLSGNVKEIIIEGAGHLIVMEALEECADALSPWLETEAQDWIRENNEIAKFWGRKSRKEQLMLSDEALQYIKESFDLYKSTPTIDYSHFIQR